MLIGYYNIEAETPEGRVVELAHQIRQHQAANLVNRLRNEVGDEYVCVNARLDSAVLLVSVPGAGPRKHVAYQAAA